jgi:hypothetical protein
MMVVLGVGLFILIGLLGIHVLVEGFRDLHALARSQCPACKKTYGKAAARRSRARYNSECRATARKIEAENEPGSVIVDILYDNEWPVECTQCGHQAIYNGLYRKLIESPGQSTDKS